MTCCTRSVGSATREVATEHPSVEAEQFAISQAAKDEQEVTIEEQSSTKSKSHSSVTNATASAHGAKKRKADTPSPHSRKMNDDNTRSRLSFGSANCSTT